MNELGCADLAKIRVLRSIRTRQAPRTPVSALAGSAFTMAP